MTLDQRIEHASILIIQLADHVMEMAEEITELHREIETLRIQRFRPCKVEENDRMRAH